MQFLTNLKHIFLLAGMLILFPPAAQSQDLAARKINLDISNASLETAFAEIERQSGMTFAYGEDVEKYASARVNIVAENISVRDAVARALTGTNLRYTQRDGSVIIHEQQPAAIPQAPVRQQETGRGSMGGTVLDQRGQPMVGTTVFIFIPGSSMGTSTDANGKYLINNVPAGELNVQFSFIGYETLEVTEVRIRNNRLTPLDVVMREGATEVEEVVVTARRSYNQANEEGVLKMQQTMAQVSSVISAQQIGRTSDKNLGEALRRVTGISTMDNKYVVVRGMGERWNEAALDGITLPSTETNAKAFSFDLIPTNIIDNVAVVKSATPDQNASFAGGYVQVNTKAIPTENFMTLQVGGTWNSVSTGKDQVGRGRGKLDWLGFDDGRRTMPKNLVWLPRQGHAAIDAKENQTMRFADMGDNHTLHTSRTPLASNYQFTVGRTWNGKKRPDDRLGFIGSLSYRNTQQQTVIEHQGHGGWMNWIEKPSDEDKNAYGPALGEHRNEGAVYKYGTVLSGIFNAGWQRGTSRVNFRNMYTRKHDNDLTFITGWDYDNGETVAPNQEHFNSPIFQDLLQNKLDGERMLGRVKLNWELAHTFVRRNEKDAVDTEAFGEYVDGELFFTDQLIYDSSHGSNRRHYDNKERDFNWGASAEYAFDLGPVMTVAKAGYMGVSKHSNFLFEEAEYSMLNNSGMDSYDPDDDFATSSFGVRTNPIEMIRNGYFWYVHRASGGDSYEADLSQHSTYLMFDHRWGTLARLVWGARAEYYDYNEITNPYNVALESQGNDMNNDGVISGTSHFSPDARDRKWQFLPSANLTVTPIENLNLRLAYSSSMIRPQFMERVFFQLYDPVLGGMSQSQGVVSTRVDALDFKAEWFPGAGEIISAGIFYRYLDKPIERIHRAPFGDGSTHYYTLQNSSWAKNWGFEFELRKNFGFISDSEILRDLYIYGNATITRSEVMALYYYVPEGSEDGKYVSEEVEMTRPLYGQTPLIYNVGLTYEGERLGLNLTANHSGRKVYMLGDHEHLYETEYEAANTILDAQISYTFPELGLTLKLNGSNLLDTRTIFYRNSREDYEKNEAGTSWGQKLLPGKNEGYDKHDLVKYKSRSGRSISFSASWTF